MRRALTAAAVTMIAIVSALATGGAWLYRPRHLRAEIGAFDHPFATGDWGRADRLDVDDGAAAGARTSFYYRPAAGTVRVDLPFSIRPGGLRVSMRATTRIRATVDVFAGSFRRGQALIPPGRWERSPGPWLNHDVDAAASAPTPLDLRLVVRSAPLVR